VELGCGLNTRYERVVVEAKRKGIQWFDLDLPEVYSLWKHFFEESEHRRFLPYSAFDEQWVAELTSIKTKPPYFFISEASTIYFSEALNRQLFQRIADHFPGSYYIFDTATRYFMERQDKHDTLRHFNARLKWQVDDVRTLTGWRDDFILLESYNFFRNPPPNANQGIPFYLPMVVRALACIKPNWANQYQINVFQLGAAS
jgi:O-methyltransferase involved in polyketide biosynthesis